MDRREGVPPSVVTATGHRLPWIAFCLIIRDEADAAGQVAGLPKGWLEDFREGLTPEPVLTAPTPTVSGQIVN